ncbi:S1 family peptidase [Salinifilum ghardaiensis]
MRKSTLLGGIAAAVLGMGLLPTAANATPETGDTSQKSASESSAGSPDQLIVGGHESTEQYDWMASLKYQGEHSCGASLIDEQWVLTAAHCVEERQPADLSLRIGSPNRSSGGTEAGVAEIVAHPDYAEKSPNGDIALIKLDRAVQQEPISIAENAGPPGTPSRILGWGVTCPLRGCGQPPEQLRELETHVTDPQQCSLSSIDEQTEICTGSEELLANACFGDSGGPQLEGRPGDWQLTGVTSRLGSPAPVCGTSPSVYTDATAYTDWINATTA